ncbi:hypothetical protein [Burkholderia glumae]|nr:hypothetical protein [Burkholderia glumae]
MTATDIFILIVNDFKKIADLKNILTLSRLKAIMLRTRIAARQLSNQGSA